MADFWKSSSKYYCPVCKLTIGAGGANILIHENSDSHKANIQKHIKNFQYAKRSAEKSEDELAKKIKLLQNLCSGSTLRRETRVQPEVQHEVGHKDVLSIKAKIQDRIRSHLQKSQGKSNELSDMVGNISPIDNTHALRSTEILWFPDFQSIPNEIKVHSSCYDVDSWVSSLDANTGLPYWHNSKINISLWKDPKSEISTRSGNNGKTTVVQQCDQPCVTRQTSPASRKKKEFEPNIGSKMISIKPNIHTNQATKPIHVTLKFAENIESTDSIPRESNNEQPNRESEGHVGAWVEKITANPEMLDQSLEGLNVRQKPRNVKASGFKSRKKLSSNEIL